jgi:hypothetical protein
MDSVRPTPIYKNTGDLALVFSEDDDHGVSRGNGITMKRAAERRENTRREFSFAPAGACECFTLGSQGSRRGLPSNAAPQLFSGFFATLKN